MRAFGGLNEFYISGIIFQAVVIRFADHFEGLLVIVSRHRRRHLPFRRTRIPQVAFGFFTVLDAVEEVINNKADFGIGSSSLIID